MLKNQTLHARRSVVLQSVLVQERPSLVFGDVVYIRFACMDNAEFAGFVVATEATRCMLAMPRQFYACCAPSPRTLKENTIVSC